MWRWQLRTFLTGRTGTCELRGRDFGDDLEERDGSCTVDLILPCTRVSNAALSPADRALA